MKDVVYVSGHKNPDSDSVCSALAYAELKNRITDIKAIPVRLGELSRETQFILDYFGVKAPELLDTVKPKIKDLELDSMKEENLTTVSTEDLVEEVKKNMEENKAHSYNVVNDNGQVIGVVSKENVNKYNKKKIIQMDHNERGQAVDGINEAEIVEIIDHHRVADVQTNNPIYYRCEPIGSTSTIVGKCYFEKGIEPSKEMAGLLCGAIISDTLLFRSPTCTEEDKKICNKLAEIAGINIEEFGKEMFKAGTSLQGKTVSEIFNQDFKPFKIGSSKVGVAQVNTMDIEGFMPLKDEMLAFMNKEAEEKDYEVVLLLLTDIIKEGSQILVGGKRTDYIEKTFNVKLEDSMAFVQGLLSRKKQVIPPLTSVVTAEN